MKVLAMTTTAEVAREINRHTGLRATVWGGDGCRRVYIRRFRYILVDGATVDTECEFTIYIEFNECKAPLLTVKEADMMTKSPEWECRMVSCALSRIGIHVDCKPSPVAMTRHFMKPNNVQSTPTTWIQCNCLD